ncbi:MAG: ATP-binding protein, partial [Gammaproteobacteria bacterium]
MTDNLQTIGAVENPPDPARTIEGLRDTGYRFETAIADIIDNSIAAKASVVDLKITMDYGGNIRVSIADDGIGMNRDELINAMRYGSPARPDPSSLGKFGMGLKTASTAFCRRLSVTSRSSGEMAPLKATWDLDHVVGTGKWELLLSEPSSEEQKHLDEIAPGHSGTVVVWEKVDRLLKSYANPGGKHARNAL